MRSPLPPRTRQQHQQQRNGHPVLPIIYIPPQPRTKRRLFPLCLILSCGVWVFTLGALIQRLPVHHGRELPNLSSSLSYYLSSSSSSSTMSSSSTSSSSLSTDAMQTKTTPVIRSNMQNNNTISQQKYSDPKREVYFDIQAALQQEEQIVKKQQQQQGHTTTIMTTTHAHAIPNVLIFTHNINLLTYQPPPSNNTATMTNTSNDTKAITTIEEQEELLALQQNIQHTIDLHPNAHVRFLTDAECLDALTNMLGANAPLIHYFQTETTGMYKADICRGAALWETGGLYLDVDVGVRMPLWNALSHNTTFATSLVHKQSHHVGNFFQAFMATTPRHTILERYLQLFQDYYQGTLTRPIHKGPLGVILLRQAFDDVTGLIPGGDNNNGKEYFRIGPKTVDTASYGRAEIWQEVQYNPQWFPDLKPAPTWGTRRACHFVVVANRHFPLVVPLYSRIAGSRMCKTTSPTTTHHDDKKEKDKDVSRHQEEDNHRHHHHEHDYHDQKVTANVTQEQ